MRKNKFDSLTGLKGLFSLIIVFFHTLPNTPLVDQIPLTSIIKNYGGTLGNYFFFIVSGFLISVGYLERIGRKEISFKDFMVKRLYKLYPLYLITNLVSIALEVVQFGWSGINLKRIVMMLLLQSGGGLETAHPYNGPAWFLSALFVCYMVFFFMAYHGKKPTQYYAMVFFGIVWGYSLLEETLVMPLAFARHGGSFFGFFTGCALAGLYPLLEEKLPKWSQYAALLVLAGSAYLMMRYGVGVIAGDVGVAFTLLLCPLLMWLAVDNKLFSLFLQSRPVRYLGKISFSVYLWHFEIYLLFREVYFKVFGGESIGDAEYLVYLILMLMVGALSHRFIENKGQKKRLESCI